MRSRQAFIVAGLFLCMNAIYAQPQPEMPAPAVAEPTPVVAGESIADALFPSSTPEDARVWITGQYLLMIPRAGGGSIPLATTGPVGSGAVLGRAAVGGAIGGDRILNEAMHGFRISAGMWLNARPEQFFGFEVSGFYTPDNTKTASVTSDATSVLARPFFDTALGAQNSRIIASPGAFSGNISRETASSMWGVDVGPVIRVYDEGGWSLDQLLGFKALGLNERYIIRDSSTATANGLIAFNGTNILGPATVSVVDSFTTQNRLLGGSLGARLNYSSSRWSTSLALRFTAGIVQQNYKVEGTSTLMRPNAATQVISSGMLAVGSNSGNFIQKGFGYAPEGSFNLAYRISDRWSINAGYDFLYWASVIRPDDAVTQQINPRSFPTSATFGQTGGGTYNATTQFNTTAFWVHGIRAGAQWRY